MSRVFVINGMQTKGENKMVNFLDESLPEDYTIYVQPNLDGNRPDIVIFHPMRGVFLIEIKDWKLERYYKKGGVLFLRGEADKEIPSPNSQISRYRNVFLEFMGNLPVFCILNFPNAEKDEIKNFIKTDYFPIGYDNKNEIIAFITHSRGINLKEHENEIRDFINPPKHKIDYSYKIKLTTKQKNIIEHKENSWRRVMGVAGSGKTLIIANKAAKIASEGKKVLIVTFNKTLKAYIKERIEESQEEFDWNLIECCHFHGFLKNYIKENDGKAKKLEEMVPKAQELIANEMNTKNRQYDAILIDEAQDFEKEWFDILLYFLSKNNEVLLVADDKQNIYDRELSWINKSMAGFGYHFKGAWGRLDENKRNNDYLEVLEEADRFANLFLKEFLEKNPEKSLGTSMLLKMTSKNYLRGFAHLFWRDMIDKLDFEIIEKIHAIYKYLREDKGYDAKDIAILTPNRKLGKSIVESFQKNNIASMNIFGKGKKESFCLKEDEVKISTIHSFKGLESKAVIFINNNKDNISNAFETYVAITRAVDFLVVINRAKQFCDYGKDWEKYR